MFSFDRLTSRQRRARNLLLPAGVVGGVLFLSLVPLLGHLLGGVWAVGLVMQGVGTPLGALWWMSERDASWRSAWWRGAVLALAATVAYAWAFA